MNRELTYVPFDSIVVTDNVRLTGEGRLQIPQLAADIAENGLQEPITIGEVDGVLTVARGHRRFAAIKALKEGQPEAYKAHFDGGVMAIVYTAISLAELKELKVDHGNELALTDPFEVQLCGDMLFDAGKTEKEVVIKLAGIMERVSPMKSAKRKELGQIEDKVTEAKSDKDNAKVATLQKEADELVFGYRRGFVQTLNNVYRCPDKVRHTLRYKASGEVHEDVSDEYLPNLTTANVRALYTAHKKDLEILDESNLPRYNKRRPGPNFNEKWNQLVDADQDKEGKKAAGEAKPKAMAAKDMQAEMGKWNSEGFKKLTLHHSGDKSVEGLVEADQALYFAELVIQEDPKAWKAFVKAAKAIEKTLLADATVEGEAVPEKTA